MKVIVVGGGISGIAASYFLNQAGIETTLIEANPTLGGRLGFGSLGERAISFGGKNIGKRYTEMRAFCHHHRVDDFEYFGVNTSRIDNGSLVSVDFKRPLRTLYNMLSTCHPLDLWRFGRFARRIQRFPADGFADSPFFTEAGVATRGLTLDQLFSTRFCQQLIRPMVVRMNGAESDEIYLSSFGSNLRVLLDSYDQLSSGMEVLIERFAESTNILLNTSVASLKVEDGRVRGVIVNERENGGQHELISDAVCVALPAPAAAHLLSSSSKALASLLGAIRYFPVHVVIVQYNRPIFNPAIRAVVFDDNCVISNAGAYGADDLETVRYTFSGRQARALIAEGVSDDQLLSLAEAALNTHIPVDCSDRIQTASRRFDPGLCAFSANTRGLNERIDSQEELDGVYFTGDYRKGASIEACFVAAKHCARCIASMPMVPAT